MTMKTESTELIFVLDKSGSMHGLEKDTIGGFNSTVEKQRKEEGEVKVTTVLFDTLFTTIHDRMDIKDVPVMTEDDYCPSGCTALLDAVGTTIDRFIKEQKDSDAASKTLMIITTDGLENASKEYSYDTVNRLISDQKEKGWEFIFMGANIDAAKEAVRMGISKENAVDYVCDDEGIKACYNSVDCAIKNVRKGVKLKECSWRAEADMDFKRRA